VPHPAESAVAAACLSPFLKHWLIPIRTAPSVLLTAGSKEQLHLPAFSLAKNMTKQQEHVLFGRNARSSLAAEIWIEAMSRRKSWSHRMAMTSRSATCCSGLARITTRACCTSLHITLTDFPLREVYTHI
jgi:hypothetical protein